MTYSINISTPTESTSNNGYDLSTGIPDILNLLPDNEDKQISPKDIRDSVLSTWDVPSFKETTSTSSNISYIGIDTGNPSDRDNKLKIFFGKRQLNGVDIMSDTLLNNDSDIFFHNTKIDTLSQTRTRISILAGSNFNLHNNSPYIQSQFVSGSSASSLDLINNSGDISIKSEYDRVYVNNIGYPTLFESGLSASNKKTLRYNSGEMFWDDITNTLGSNIGITGSQLDIYGSEVLVNGNPIEYTNLNGTPARFHGVGLARTFNKSPIIEVLREILYPYLSPLCSLAINQSIAEFGTYPVISLNYSITKRSLNLNTTTLSNMIPGSIPPINTSGHITTVGVANGIYISNIDTSFQITLNDGTQSVSASQSLNFVYPYFHGLLSSPNITYTGLSTLDKVVSDYSDQLVGLLGSGYIYFIYDNDYPNLSQILDETSTDITSSFTYSVVTLNSPTWLWASHQFKVYRSMTSSYSFDPPSTLYQFKF